MRNEKCSEDGCMTNDFLSSSMYVNLYDELNI